MTTRANEWAVRVHTLKIKKACFKHQKLRVAYVSAARARSADVHSRCSDDAGEDDRHLKKSCVQQPRTQGKNTKVRKFYTCTTPVEHDMAGARAARSASRAHSRTIHSAKRKRPLRAAVFP